MAAQKAQRTKPPQQLKRVDYFAVEIVDRLDREATLEKWEQQLLEKPGHVDLFGLFRGAYAQSQTLLVKNGLRPALPKIAAPKNLEVLPADNEVEELFRHTLENSAGALLHLSNTSIVGGLFVQFRRLVGDGPPRNRLPKDVLYNRSTLAVVVDGAIVGTSLDTLSYRPTSALLEEGSRGGFFTYAAQVAVRYQNPITHRVEPMVDFHFASAVSRHIVGTEF